MKAPDIFIIIPSIANSLYYIRPYDIVCLIERKGGTTVTYKMGKGVESFATVLTARGIHERIIELETQSFTFTFGEDND